MVLDALWKLANAIRIFKEKQKVEILGYYTFASPPLPNHPKKIMKVSNDSGDT